MHLIKPMLNDLFIAQDPTTIFWMPIVDRRAVPGPRRATYATDFGMARIGRGVVQTLRSEVFARYLRLPAAYLRSRIVRPADLALIYTVEQVANASTDALKTLILHSLTCSASPRTCCSPACA